MQATRVTTPPPVIPVSQSVPAANAPPVRTAAEKSWVVFHTAAFAGSGTVLSFSMRPLLMKLCIEQAAHLLGDEPGKPSPLATALGTAVAEGVIAPIVLGAGTMTAESVGRLVKRIFTSADVVAGESPGYVKNVGEHIGTAFSIMSFALAYQAAMDGPRNTAEDVFLPAAFGGGLTGAAAVLAALLQTRLRGDLKMQGPEHEGNCGQQLCERLRSACGEANRNALLAFGGARARAAAEMNRELVLNLIPVFEAQIIFNVLQLFMDPSRDNVLGLSDRHGFSAREQYALIMASLTMLIHTTRVDGWTNHLFGSPVPKNELEPMTGMHALKDCGAALVNLATACVSAWLVGQAIQWGQGESIAEAAVDAGSLAFGEPVQVLDLVGGLLAGALALRAIGSGAVDEVFRFREMAGSAALGLTGAVADALAPLAGGDSFAAGVVMAAGINAFAQPPHEIPDVRTMEGRQRVVSEGVPGLAAKSGAVVFHVLREVAGGVQSGLETILHGPLDALRQARTSVVRRGSVPVATDPADATGQSGTAIEMTDSRGPAAPQSPSSIVIERHSMQPNDEQSSGDEAEKKHGSHADREPAVVARTPSRKLVLRVAP